MWQQRSDPQQHSSQRHSAQFPAVPVQLAVFPDRPPVFPGEPNLCGNFHGSAPWDVGSLDASVRFATLVPWAYFNRPSCDFESPIVDRSRARSAAPAGPPRQWFLHFAGCAISSVCDEKRRRYQSRKLSPDRHAPAPPESPPDRRSTRTPPATALSWHPLQF
jgi:hypothetical protein